MNGVFAVILGMAHIISMTSIMTLMAILESAMILLSLNQLQLPQLPKSTLLLLHPLKNGWRNEPTMDEPSSKTITLGKSSQCLQDHLPPHSWSNQWHDTLSADYHHPIESAHLTFFLTFADTQALQFFRLI